MDIQIFQPKHPRLQALVQNYYVLQSQKDETVTYLTFPKPYSVLSLYKGAEITHLQNRMRIEAKLEAPLIADLTFSYSQPLLIEYQGSIRELTVYFKPLGIHAFGSPFKGKATKSEEFFTSADDRMKLDTLLDRGQTEALIDSLETYLVSKLTEFRHPFLHRFVEAVTNDPTLSLAQLSKSYGISQKTLIKHAKAYLFRTPSQFIKVVRFYSSLKAYDTKGHGTLSLTEIGYSASFFDQAHMIKEFKTLTGFTPRRFFNNLERTDGNLNWIFL
ncbi:MAG: helix-turn-helix transcriptional regulator [Flavobacteriaceae bacterium]|nr:helix-turn-helix transcriptional regulator [Flavobacteriaceae bacterium]